MKKSAFVLLSILAALFVVAPAVAGRAELYVDDDGFCGGNRPCFRHPQDAVNAAQPGQTIAVYPGYYGSRLITPLVPPHYSLNDQYAPALIIYKDGLTLAAVDKDPATTIIAATHAYWSNPVAVQASTGGVWNGGAYEAAGVNPSFGSEPNAISIIASDVTVEGFTIMRAFSPTSGGHNALLIGGLYDGYGTHGEAVGFSGNTVQNNVFFGGSGQSINGVNIWHSSDNRVIGNTIIDPWKAAISVYDGYTDAEVGLQPSSRDNVIQKNTVIDDPATYSLGQAVFIGAWIEGQPDGSWTDNSGTKVINNDCGGMILFTAYSFGDKKFHGNKNVGGTAFFNASDFKFSGNPDADKMVPSDMEKIPHGLPVN